MAVGPRSAHRPLRDRSRSTDAATRRLFQGQVADDQGKTIAYTSEAEATATGRDPDGVPNRDAFETTMGGFLAENPKNLVFTHGPYYRALDLAY